MSTNKIQPLGEYAVTTRGFGYVKFTDVYDLRCSIQQNSMLSGDRLWLGIDDPKPQIMASDARALGYPTRGVQQGWVTFDLPNEVLMQTRMHLDKEQVRGLITRLQHWVDTGELKFEDEEIK